MEEIIGSNACLQIILMLTCLSDGAISVHRTIAHVSCIREESRFLSLSFCATCLCDWALVNLAVSGGRARAGRTNANGGRQVMMGGLGV